MISDPKENYHQSQSISNATSVSNLEDTYPTDPYLSSENHQFPPRKNNYLHSEHEYRFNTDLIVDSKNEDLRDSMRNPNPTPPSKL